MKLQLHLSSRWKKFGKFVEKRNRVHEMDSKMYSNSSFEKLSKFQTLVRLALREATKY
jgi:hypothetical protein